MTDKILANTCCISFTRTSQFLQTRGLQKIVFTYLRSAKNLAYKSPISQQVIWRDNVTFNTSQTQNEFLVILYNVLACSDIENEGLQK